MTSNQRKNILYTLFLFGVMGIVYIYRNYIKPSEPPTEQVTKVKFQGYTMGTTYSIAYIDTANRMFQTQVDSVLKEFNLSLSTYIPESEISRFNREDSLTFSYSYFYPVMKRAKEVYEVTNGAFNPTVLPLVEAWGFGRPDQKSEQPEALIDSLLLLVDMESLIFDQKGIRKTKPHVSLDFSAIAKGNGIDVVAHYLESQGIHIYMVLIGGEANCKGGNDHGKGWMIGIDNPELDKNATTPSAGYFWLNDKSIATSGNYRKFYMKEGKRYAHTISPKTGYPVTHNLLSVTVFAADCTTADAYATAFMVMGKEKALNILTTSPDLDAYLIYDDNGVTKTYLTAKAKAWMVRSN